MPQEPVDPWGVKSVAPYNPPSAAVSDPWGTPNDPNHPAGLPDGVDLPQLPDHAPVNMKPSILGRDPNPGPVANFFKGAVKSIPGTMAGIAKLYPGASDAVDPLEQAAQTNGTAQAIGKGVGNAAQ